MESLNFKRHIGAAFSKNLDTFFIPGKEPYLIYRRKFASLYHFTVDFKKRFAGSKYGGNEFSVKTLLNKYITC